jgi:hypothetical protein
MKLTIQILLTAVAAYFSQLYFPWWSAVIMAGIIAIFIPVSGWKSFWGGFFGVGILWLAKAILLQTETLPLLADRVAALFQLPHSFFLFLITFLVGGLASGFGAVTGNSLRGVFIKRRKGYYGG